ncbi:MAG: hypothetical protein ACRDIU_02705 [Actinomycetota bacterium]
MVDVGMREYRFDFKPPAGRGRVVFKARNTGRLDHELVLAILPEDVPPIRTQLKGNNRMLVATLAKIPPRAAGKAGVFAVDLTPGRYAMICFVTDADGRQHAQKGMGAEFRIASIA